MQTCCCFTDRDFRGLLLNLFGRVYGFRSRGADDVRVSVAGARPLAAAGGTQLLCPSGRNAHAGCYCTVLQAQLPPAVCHAVGAAQPGVSALLPDLAAQSEA